MAAVQFACDRELARKVQEGLLFLRHGSTVLRDLVTLILRLPSLIGPTNALRNVVPASKRPFEQRSGRRCALLRTRVLAAADGGKRDLGTWGPEPKKPRSGPTPERAFTPRFSPYVLRHTCATLALIDGVDLLQVSRRLRHKTITITAQFYGHLKAEHTTEAAESFNRLAAGVR